MAWLSSFLLGRPTFENAFDLNPLGMRIEESQLAAQNRTLDGSLHKYVFRTAFPIISIDSDYLLLADRNIMASLLNITDTILSFIPRTADLQSVLEINAATLQTSVTIQTNSATKLSAAIVAAGGSSIISISGVWTALSNASGVISGSGTNYFTGGSYADSTNTITLGSPLSAAGNVYITYSYSGWGVMIEKMPYHYQGGWIDKGNYSGWVLTGV